MSIENLKEFLHDLGSNKELQEKINSIVAKYKPSGTESEIIPDNMTFSIKEEVVRLAQGNGYDFSVKDMENYEKEQAASPEIRELSDNELHTVPAGGECVCVMGGGGKKGEKGDEDGVCACVLVGIGYDYTGEEARCGCTGAGSGRTRD